MSPNLTFIIFLATTLVLLTLVLTVLYLVFVYRKLLDKYTDLTLDEVKSETRKRLHIDISSYVNSKLDNAVSKSLTEAVGVITKAADAVAKTMRKKTIEKLVEEEKAEERAVASEYDAVKAEIENYKLAKFEDIKRNAHEVLAKVTKNTLGELLDESQEEKLILQALEDAKQSKIF